MIRKVLTPQMGDDVGGILQSDVCSVDHQVVPMRVGTTESHPTDPPMNVLLGHIMAMVKYSVAITCCPWRNAEDIVWPKQAIRKSCANPFHPRGPPTPTPEQLSSIL